MSFYIFNDRIGVHLCDRLADFDSCAGMNKNRIQLCVNCVNLCKLISAFTSLVKHLT